MKNEAEKLQKLTFRQIHPDEAEDVVHLHQEVVADEEIATSIYSSPGVAQYLRQLLKSRAMRVDNLFVGAWSENALVGYAHFKALSTSWHLNQIAVLSDYQGHGIGTHLWNLWIKEGGERNYLIGSLDVRQENARALGWYLRKGLRIIAHKYLLEKELPTDCGEHYGSCSFKVINWSEAEKQQKSVGFSSLLLDVDGETFPIGRLGSHYFRTDYEPPLQVQMILGKLDPDRRLLVFSDQPLNNYVQIGLTLRMHVALPNGPLQKLNHP